MAERFTASPAGVVRRYWEIPRFQPSAEPTPNGEGVTIPKTAQMLGMNASNIAGWLANGLIQGE